MNKIAVIISGFICSTLASCDEGRIFSEAPDIKNEGGTAYLSVSTKGNSDWGDSYTLALAGFEDGNEYALISTNVKVADDGSCSATLEGIPSQVNTVEFCVIDRLRRKVSSFISVPAVSSELQIDQQGIDISMAGALQKDIFNTTCVQCHGGSGYAAASLNLTDGESFPQLVNIASVKEPGKLRVAPGSASESVLYRILSTSESSSWAYDHSVEVISDVKHQLIRNWINEGAYY